MRSRVSSLAIPERAKHIEPYLLQNIARLVPILHQSMDVVRQPFLIERDQFMKCCAISYLSPQHQDTLVHSLRIVMQIGQVDNPPFRDGTLGHRIQ